MVTNKKGETHTTPFTLTDGMSQEFVLADGDKAVIYGLSANDTYTVTETTEAVSYTHLAVYKRQGGDLCAGDHCGDAVPACFAEHGDDSFGPEQ